MSRGYQILVLKGNVGREPEMRYTPTGKPVCTTSLAVGERWTSDDGERHERTEWFNLEAWGKNAETMIAYVHKGDNLLLEGKLHTDEYEQDGQKKRFTKVRIKELNLLGNNRGNQEGDNAPVPGAEFADGAEFDL